MWTPTHVVVTVTQARNLLEKGKGGNDAYCMIGMGKEKFLTSVKTKTLKPVWDEQAEFALGEREDLKLTVYHKSSIIDEFIGRAVINVAELASFDNTHSHVAWFKLGGKPDKSENSKKTEKERGEIEVRIDFLVKPKAGSMMDLSMKNKEKSLSLRNLKDKSNTLKQSLGDKFKILQKSRKSKFAGENQLAEQAKQMGGSKIDFLDGDDVGSITSSYSSINGSNLQRFNDSKQINSMSRFNPTRSSFLSGNSSRIENDSASNYGNDNTRNDDDFEYENDNSNEFDQDSANGSSFQRRNSSKFGRSTNGAIRRQLSRRSSQLSTPIIEDLKIINENSKIELKEENTNYLHIAPLPPFNNENTNANNNATSTPALSTQRKERTNNKKSETNTSSSILSKPTSPTVKANTTDDFASIFAASFNNTTKSSNLTLTHSNTTNDSITTTSLSSNSPIKKQAPLPPPPPPSHVKIVEPPPLPPMPKSLQKKQDEEDEDHIDWASSEDEEIVKQEIETFERNQVPKTNTNLLETSTTTTTTTTTTTNNNNKLEIENSLILPESTSKQDSLFSDLFSPFEINNKPVINPLAQTFSIDIDPFSSESTSTNSSFTSNNQNKTQITDPFGFNIAPTTTASNLYFNPFQDNFTDNFSKKMSNDETEPISILDFSKADDLNGSTPFDQDDQDNNNKQEEKEEEENKLFFYKPSIPLNNPQLTFVEQNRDDDEDNIDNAFIAYSNEHHTHDKVETDEMTIISNELADTKLKLKEILEEELVNTTDELPVDETTTENNDRPFNVVDTAISDSDSDSIEFNGHKLTNKFNMDNVNIKQFNIGDDEEEEEEEDEEKKVMEAKEPLETIQIRSTLTASPESIADDSTKSNSLSRQSERRRIMPAEDLISDLNSETDFHSLSSDKSKRNNKKLDLKLKNNNNSRSKQAFVSNDEDYDVKTPDIDIDYRFQDEKKLNTTTDSNGAMSSNENNQSGRNNNGLPDLVNQKGNNESTDKARKYLEGLDGVKFNEIQVPDQLKKQLEYFDRDELLQLIAYQKKYLDFKESRIKDLENYIDNLVVKIIEKEPSILMNASNVLTKSRNLI